LPVQVGEASHGRIIEAITASESLLSPEDDKDKENEIKEHLNCSLKSGNLFGGCNFFLFNIVLHFLLSSYNISIM